MAHKTRKKLTKKEIKHDPVREKLEAGLIFIQTHQKEILGGLIVVVLIILVGQYMLARRNSAGEEAMAGFITASQLFTQSTNAASMNQLEQAFQGMDAAYSMSMQTWNANPQNEWARKAAILGAKIDIIRGNYDTAISTLQTLMAANPGRSIQSPALLHMGIVLENRGSEQDVAKAEASYMQVLEIEDGETAVRAEALLGLSRIYFKKNQFEQSSEYLNQALAMSSDTTAFENYRIAQLAQAAQ